MRTYYLFALIVVVLVGCADSTDDLDFKQSEVVYGASLDVHRIDDVQRYKIPSGNFTDDKHNERIKNRWWEKLSYMRTAAYIRTICTQNFMPSVNNTGSGVLIGPDLILTADHVIRGRDSDNGTGCDAHNNENLTFSGNVTFSIDRLDNSADGFDGSKPPHNWLLQNRLHALSLYQSGKIEAGTPIELFASMVSIPVDWTGKYSGIENKKHDLAVVKSKTNYSLKGGGSIPWGVLFDWIQLPNQGDPVLTQDDKDRSVVAIHVNKDPNVEETGRIVSSSWRTDFDPYSEESGDVKIIRDAIQISDNSKLANSSLLDNECSSTDFSTTPRPGYFKRCVFSNLEVLRSSSGGAVLIEPEKSYERLKLIGVVHSAPKQDWSNPPNLIGIDYQNDKTFSLPNSARATGIYPLDASVVDENQTNPGTYLTPEPTKDAYRDTCVGKCNSDESGKTVLFDCSEGFANPYSEVGGPNQNNSEWYFPTNEEIGNWKIGNAVGIVGGPWMGTSTPHKGDFSDIEGVGSFSLVCDKFAVDNSQRNYADHWGQLKSVGFLRTKDALVIPDRVGKVMPLMSINQTIPLELSVEGEPPAGGVAKYHRPIPMKLCPPGQVLSGLKVFYPSGASYIQGVHSIRCTELGTLTKTYYKMKIDDNGDFNQYIGKVDAPESHVMPLVCGDSDFVTGFYTYIHNDAAERHASPLVGLALRCLNLSEALN